MSVLGYSRWSASLLLHMSSFLLSPGQGGDGVKVLRVSFHAESHSWTEKMKSGRRAEEMEGREFKIVSKQAIPWSPPSLFTPSSYSLSLHPLLTHTLSLCVFLSLSLPSYTDRSTDASAGIRSLDFPSLRLSSAPLRHLPFPPQSCFLVLSPPWWTDNCPAILRPWVPASAKVTKVSAIKFVPLFVWLDRPTGRIWQWSKLKENELTFRKSCTTLLWGITMNEESAAAMEVWNQCKHL